MRSIIAVILFSCCLWLKPPVELIGAKEQKWVSGVPDGGSSTRYSLIVVANRSSEKLKFTKLVVGQISLDVQVWHKSNLTTQSDKFEKGDTLLIVAQLSEHHEKQTQKRLKSSIISKENSKEISQANTEKSGNSSQCKGLAHLSYTIKQREKTLCIKSFEKLTNQYMP